MLLYTFICVCADIDNALSDVQEADVSEARTEVASISGDRSAVPQTWVDKKYIGGLGDLKVCPPSRATRP